ncbi:MAG: dienelactone hydrolase family protein [Pseudomonadota bacterium]
MTLQSSSSGFAAATRPVTLHTRIDTDTIGLAVGDIVISTGESGIPGYFAKPIKPGCYPIVLVVQEIFGVHEHIRDIVRRLAKLDYIAIAPELFYRWGNVGAIEDIEEIRKVVAQVPDSQVLADLDASLEWAASNGGDANRVAITGFCWGGRITWLYAAHQPNIKAGVAWYGKISPESTPLQPHTPLEYAEKIKPPILGLYGGSDPSIPLDDIYTFKETLATMNSASDIHVYPDAPHAFFADYRPSYRKDAAEDGWERLQKWLKQHGV